MKKNDFNLKEIMSSEKNGGKMNYTNLYKMISKPWINTKEIQQICQCGERKATKIRKTIEEEVISTGKHLPVSGVKVIPTPILLKYLNISENYVYEMAKKEKNLNEGESK